MKRRRVRQQRGFALFAVIILLAIVTAAVALSLDEAVDSIQSAGRVRTAEIVRGALDQGLTLAMQRLQQEDPATLAEGDWDIFGVPAPPGTKEFIPVMDYPPTGPYQGQYRVRVGLRPGQRTRPPEGEDVTASYGQIVEIQVSVDANGVNGGSNWPAEERVAVGVMLPRQAAQAQ